MGFPMVFQSPPTIIKWTMDRIEIDDAASPGMPGMGLEHHEVCHLPHHPQALHAVRKQTHLENAGRNIKTWGNAEKGGFIWMFPWFKHF